MPMDASLLKALRKKATTLSKVELTRRIGGGEVEKRESPGEKEIKSNSERFIGISRHKSTERRR